MRSVVPLDLEPIQLHGFGGIGDVGFVEGVHDRALQTVVLSEERLQFRERLARAIQTVVGGEVVCDVTHRDDRKFTVVAGDVEVRVVGTKFSVKSRDSASEGGKGRMALLPALTR